MLVKIAIVLAFQALHGSAGLCQPSSEKALQVVIFAVSHFDDHEWDNPQLQLSIEKSTRELEDFFRNKFPHAKVHLLTEPNQTASDDLRHFLRSDFRRFADGTVTLFFVLSHGVPAPSPNPNFNQDLLIVARDTTKAHPEIAGFSVAQDLIPEFTHLKSSGSIVLAFLDTCYSGESMNLNMRIAAALAENYGLRMMVMASSLSEAESYKATFTHALIDLWSKVSNGSCTTPELAPTELRKSIGQQLQPQKLGPIEGLPKIVIPYYGKLCLESFAADSGLIVFYNALPNTVAAIIEENGKPIDDPIPIETNDVVPYKLSRHNYELNIVRSDAVRLSRHNVDLNTEPVSFETIGIPKSDQIGSVYMRSADYIEAAGLPADQVTGYQKRAFASFIATNNTESASLVASRLRQRDQRFDREWQLAYALSEENVTALGQGDTPVESQARSELGLKRLAKVEMLSGKFDKAADSYLKVAEQSPAETRSEYATQAYFAAGAAGDLEFARRTRTRFDLTLTSECPSCTEKEEAAWAEREHPAKASDDFKSLCMLKALGQLDFEVLPNINEPTPSGPGMTFPLTDLPASSPPTPVKAAPPNTASAHTAPAKALPLSPSASMLVSSVTIYAQVHSTDRNDEAQADTLVKQIPTRSTAGSVDSTKLLLRQLFIASPSSLLRLLNDPQYHWILEDPAVVDDLSQQVTAAFQHK